MPDPKQRQTVPFPSKPTTVSGDTSPETTLVARCRAGDVDAFETLYKQHGARIFSLASRMAGSPEEGEDLLQEIFLQAYRKLGSFKGDASIGTWLYRLALELCADENRRVALRVKLARALSDAGRGGEAAPLFLERLPAGCREAFVLHDVEGYDHKEVAGMLGIAEGTSKSQVFKARMKLRATLNR